MRTNAPKIMNYMASTDFALELERMGSEDIHIGNMETYKDEFAILIHRGLLDSLEESEEARQALAKILCIESVSTHSGYRYLLIALEEVLDICSEPKRSYSKVISALYQVPRYNSNKRRAVIKSLRQRQVVVETQIKNPKSLQWGFPK